MPAPNLHSCNHIAHQPVAWPKTPQSFSFYRFTYEQWFLLSEIPTWCLPYSKLFFTHPPPARSCSEVADAFSADQTDACARSGSVIRHTEGFCSSHQMRSHVEIITCLGAAFILSLHRLDRYVFLICSATPPYYANAHCNGFRPIDQI